MTTLGLRDLGFLAAATPVTLFNIKTALWLDAADSSSVIITSGAVSQWNDKSGNGRHAQQSSSSNRPTYTTAGQNNLGTIVFDNTSLAKYLDIATTEIITRGNSNFGIFAAYKARVAASGYGTLFGNYPSGLFALYFGGIPVAHAQYLVPWGIYIDGYIDADLGSYTQNKNYLISATRTSGQISGRTDGTQKQTVGSSSSFYSTPVPTNWKIGVSTNNTESAFMDLYELICINGTVDFVTVEKIEGYLAHKWNLTASLPNDHPYKNSAPT